MQRHLAVPRRIAAPRDPRERKAAHIFQEHRLRADVLHGGPGAEGGQLAQKLQVRGDSQPRSGLPNFNLRPQGCLAARVARVAQLAARVGRGVFVPVMIVQVKPRGLDLHKLHPLQEFLARQLHPLPGEIALHRAVGWKQEAEGESIDFQGERLHGNGDPSDEGLQVKSLHSVHLPPWLLNQRFTKTQITFSCV